MGPAPYGAIDGGTITTSGSAELIGQSRASVLNGVTLAGTLELMTGGDITGPTVTGGLTLQQGHIKIPGAHLIFRARRPSPAPARWFSPRSMPPWRFTSTPAIR